MRLPGNLRDAAILAAELGLAASTTELTVRGLRDAHYRSHPDACPDLAEIALAAAEIDGHPLAARPDLVRRAAVALDTLAGNEAAAIRSSLGVSVADAHLGAVLGATEGPHAVLISDTGDLRRIAKHLGARIKVVRA